MKINEPLEGVLPEPATCNHPVWDAIAPALTRREFRHPEQMDAAFLRLLFRAQRVAGVPFRIAAELRPAGPSPAKPCRAVVLYVVSNEERYRVVRALFAVGFARVGVYPAHEDESGTIHADATGAALVPGLWTHHELPTIQPNC